MGETQVWSLGQEDPLEKEMATHSSILAWEMPWTEEPGGLQSTGRKESDTTERLHFHFHFNEPAVESSILNLDTTGCKLQEFELITERMQW